MDRVFLAIDLFGGMFWIAENFHLASETPRWPANTALPPARAS